MFSRHDAAQAKAVASKQHEADIDESKPITCCQGETEKDRAFDRSSRKDRKAGGFTVSIESANNKMTNTRAASATASLRAKQELVRLLFGREYSRRGPQAHRLLDHSIYSYADLRAAYLERIHFLHPDKKNANSSSSSSSAKPAIEDENDGNRTTDAARFVELQEAWNRYEEIAKMMKKVGQGSRDGNARVDANFTMFGVGCSFSDNEEEREMRNRIMDQASRGWFSAGELSERTEDRREGGKSSRQHEQELALPRLISDDMFDQMAGEDHDRENDKAQSKPKAQTTLISHLIPPHRR